MAKVKPRLGSRKKAKRWAKGQSSSSNPETKKHRNQARTWFFQQNPGIFIYFIAMFSQFIYLSCSYYSN